MSARDLVLQCVEKLPANAGWTEVLDEVLGLAASHQEMGADEAGISALLERRTAELAAVGVAGCVPHAQVLRQAASWPGR